MSDTISVPYQNLSELIEYSRKEKIRLSGLEHSTEATRRYAAAVNEVYEAALKMTEETNSYSSTHTKIP